MRNEFWKHLGIILGAVLSLFIILASLHRFFWWMPEQFFDVRQDISSTRTSLSGQIATVNFQVAHLLNATNREVIPTLNEHTKNLGVGRQIRLIGRGPTKASKGLKTFPGFVQSIDLKNRELVVQNGYMSDPFYLVLADDADAIFYPPCAQFSCPGQSIPITDIKPGDPIAVSYERRAGGKLIAKRISKVPSDIPDKTAPKTKKETPGAPINP